jgi:hypothetical protein
METSALFEQSFQVKRAADAFLEETKLLSFLQSYGTVQLNASRQVLRGDDTMGKSVQ